MTGSRLSHAVSGGNYQGVTAENVTVTIAEVDVSANNRPVFTSDDIFDKKENETEVGTVVATDADARDPITGYEITGGGGPGAVLDHKWGRIDLCDRPRL